MPEQLFRKAAFDRCQARWLGEIVLVRPLSFSVLTLIAATMALALLAFFICGEYTKRSTVSGRLMPDGGVLKVYSAQPGIIIKKNVGEGQAVKRGAVLYVISSERQINSDGQIQATVSRQVALRQQSLRAELTHTRQLQQDALAALRKKIEALDAERRNIAHQIDGQRMRADLAESGLKRANQLLAKGYISAEVAQQKQGELLDQQSRLQALERDLISTEREIQAQRSDMASLPLRNQNDVAQLERLLSSTDQEWTESEGKRSIAVVAPDDGIATAVVGEVGQNVSPSQPLASVIPSGATLRAYLYAPSRAIGFLRAGDRVLLRYQAYPYQKFGSALGTVSSVSRTALPPSEITGDPSPTSETEPLYRITVSLATQTFAAYGKSEPLQAGMLVDADILQERRKLYEWVLEPLFSLSGKL